MSNNEIAKNGIVFIMRGLPSIGKSTLANGILSKIVPESTKVLSSYDYFLEKNIEIDTKLMNEAHKWNFERYKQAIADKVSVIIVDNSSIKLYHYRGYLDYGQRNDYLVSIVTIPHNDVDDKRLAERSTHGVSRFTISRMRRDFEWKTE